MLLGRKVFYVATINSMGIILIYSHLHSMFKFTPWGGTWGTIRWTDEYLWSKKYTQRNEEVMNWWMIWFMQVCLVTIGTFLLVALVSSL